MRDYTKEGVPIAQLPTDEIYEALIRGVELNDFGGYRSEDEALRALRKRLWLELDIRRWGLRG